MLIPSTCNDTKAKDKNKEQGARNREYGTKNKKQDKINKKNRPLHPLGWDGLFGSCTFITFL